VEENISVGRNSDFKYLYLRMTSEQKDIYTGFIHTHPDPHTHTPTPTLTGMGILVRSFPMQFLRKLQKLIFELGLGGMTVRRFSRVGCHLSKKLGAGPPGD